MANKLSESSTVAATGSATKLSLSDGQRRIALASIAAQLVAVIFVALLFRIENPAFQTALPWIGGGIVIHHFLPSRLRLPFFTLASVATLVFVLGSGPAGFNFAAAAAQGGALLAIGIGLIALCHLPIAFAARVAVLLAAGAGLVFARSALAVGDLGPIWPLLGTLFMFRLIIYVYDQQQQKTRPPLWRSLAYFFMLPGAFFPLFPVVDWKAFDRPREGDEALRIYQQGLVWMTHGVVHIVLYRLVYYHFYIDAGQVADGESLLRHLLTNFALYLRVSGQFHMIIGLLCLFGFDLPRANNHYFLADSFTDYWRRVNIYWKDFMVKIFYKPVAFRLRNHGTVVPVVAGSAVAFLATWLLHAYQSYWLRGGTYFSAQDGLFWAILGVLVMINAGIEAVRGRRRTLSKKVDLRANAAAALRTMFVFGTLCVLWSLWSATSLAQWSALWQFADGAFLGRAALALMCVGVCKLIVTYLESTKGKLLFGDIPRGANPGLWRLVAFACAVPLVLLALAGEPRVHRRVDDQTRFLLTSLTSNKPNTEDLRRMERGYYENLFDAGAGNVLDNGLRAPANWVDFPKIDILRKTGDIRYWELVPSQQKVINGYRMTTNALGLRDQEYPPQKAADAYRVAVLGSSHVMGWGVHDGEPFEAVVEKTLGNARLDRKRLEMLNFGLGGYSPVCQLGVLVDKAFPLQLDAIYYIAHGVDGALAMERLARLVANGVPLPQPFLRDIVQRAGINPRMSQLAMLRALRPYAKELVASTYAETVKLAGAAGVLPVWFYVPRVSERGDHRMNVDEMMALAKQAGFITFDLSGLFGDVPVDDLAVAPWDLHPNARGHVKMAERMVQALRSDPRMGFGAASR